MFSFINKNQTTIKKILKEIAPFLNEIKINNLFKQKDIKINGIRIKDNATVLVGDKVEIFFDFEKYLQSILKTIYEDDNIIVVDKMQGIETTSEDITRYTLETYLSKCYDYCRAVHRLDLNTKGLVIFAKNEMAYNELYNAIKSHQIKKTYKAIVFSLNAPKVKKYINNIYEDKSNNISIITDKNSDKEAILEIVHSSKINNELYEIEINLITGRMHQIRAQLAHNKMFVLGDGKYGDSEINTKYKINKQLLKAVQIEFNFANNSELNYLNNKKISTTFEYTLKDIKWVNLQKN